jgi:hypothetical protein
LARRAWGRVAIEIAVRWQLFDLERRKQGWRSGRHALVAYLWCGALVAGLLLAPLLASGESLALVGGGW